MTQHLRVALIDDDEAVLDSLRLYLERKGLVVTCFESADSFLTRAEVFDCIVADVRMPGLSGLDLLGQLRGPSPPVIMITGHGEVEMAVTAIKRGAFDFIEKPFDESRLLDTIRLAAQHRQRHDEESQEAVDLRTRFETLTERQRQVMALAAAGLSNKEIGTRLGISPRTVEIHRAWMMERMGARNLAELVRIDMRLKQR